MAKKIGKKDEKAETKEHHLSSLRTKDRAIPKHVVYVGRMPNKLTERTLEKFVAQFGEVKNVAISRSPLTGGSRGYGFIEFESHAVASNAATELNGSFLMGKALVAQVRESVNQNTFVRPDQRRRIRCDMSHRMNGYIAAPPKEPRATREEVLNALEKMAALESRNNARNKDLGIDYSFDGFSSQKSMI